MKEKRLNIVFIVSVLVTVAVAAWAMLLPESFSAAANGSMNFVTTRFGWLYVLASTAFVVFCIWLGFFSKYKNIPLGADDSKPEYSDIAWFSMLFSAGMGIGLIFWGTAEPLNFWVNPLIGIEPLSKEAMRFALAKSFLHWGINPWATFCVIALGLAYMTFRKGAPGLISSIFIPLIGEKRAKGAFGKVIDILASVATAAGVCTSLGLGVMQIDSGLNFLWNVPKNYTVQLILIIILGLLYTVTAVIGIDKGISLVCDLNVKVAVGLMICLFFVGPTTDILNNLVEGTGVYIGEYAISTTQVGAFSDPEWFGSWTIFYWAWWVAWAPFTGSFIARVSKGRTIGQFIKGVMLLPAGFSVIWFAIFGTIGFQLDGAAAIEAIKDSSVACFIALDKLPLGTIWSILVFVLVTTFFVTSANSATYVLGMYTEGGTMNPSAKGKVVWGALMAILAATLMFQGNNGLSLLQTMSIVGAFPFLFVVILAMPALLSALKKEQR